MCYGLAISINNEKKILCNGVREHHVIKKGLNDESFLDFEVYLPDIFKPVWDKNDDTCLKIYNKHGLLDEKNKPKRELVLAVINWLKDNELLVRKWFNENQELFGNQSVKGNQYMGCQSVKGNQNMGSQSVKGNQDMWKQSVKGNQNMWKQSVKGNQYMGCQSVKGNQNMGSQSVKGKMFIHGMVVGNPKSKLNKEIKRLSQEFEKQNKVLDLESFFNEITKKEKELKGK